MTEAAGDRARVDAATEQRGGDQVPEIVQPSVRHALETTQALERSGHRVGDHGSEKSAALLNTNERPLISTRQTSALWRILSS